MEKINHKKPYTGTVLLTLNDKCRGYASQWILYPTTVTQNSNLLTVLAETKTRNSAEYIYYGCNPMILKLLEKLNATML